MTYQIFRSSFINLISDNDDQRSTTSYGSGCGMLPTSTLREGGVELDSPLRPVRYLIALPAAGLTPSTGSATLMDTPLSARVPNRA